MRSSAARLERNEPHTVNSIALLNAFTRELADLCRKYGLGITGNPTLFVMEPVDNQLEYHVDDESNLSLR